MPFQAGLETASFILCFLLSAEKRFFPIFPLSLLRGNVFSPKRRYSQMARLILAEKPSVAKDIAAALPDVKRKDGHFEAKDGTVVTWGVGHLVELKEPHEYDPAFKKWDLSLLPIIPERFSYKAIERSKKQLQTVQKLFKSVKPTEVVLATDADREGELLGRLILSACGWRGAIKRFWTSEALTPGVVKKILGSLKDGSEFDNLYQEALARQHADWLIGINETRALSVTAGGKKVLSVGRVQTAILSVLAEREKKIRDFKPEPFWTLYGIFSKTRFNLIETEALEGVPFIGEEESPDEDAPAKKGITIFRFKRLEDAERVLGAVRKAGKGTVVSAETKELKEAPPQLFALSDLQREANKFYGFSAADTLKIAQSLYETHKVLSYPRTSCNHMAWSNIGLVEKSLAMLGHKIDPKKAGARVFDDKKVAAAGHHALIPLRDKSVTGKPLSENEKKIFELVKSRFVAAFMDPHIYSKTEVIVRADKYDLYASARQTLSPGWRAYYPPGWKPYEETSPVVMKARKGDVLPLDEADLNEDKTKAPPRFTEASLLSLMKNAWRYVENKDIREALKEAKGIGTEATRAGIIETLKTRGYVLLKGKAFWVTDLGLAVAETAKSLGLVAADIGFTGLWEQELSEVGEGKRRYDDFVEKVKKLVIEEINKIKGAGAKLGKAVAASEPSLTCPCCESRMRINKGGAFCEDEKKCGLKIWRNLAGKSLTDSQIKQIVEKGRVFVKGLKSKAGKSFDAWVVFDKDKGTTFDFSLPAPGAGRKAPAAGTKKKALSR
jgi:DNA topoisomerase-3